MYSFFVLSIALLGAIVNAEPSRSGPPQPFAPASQAASDPQPLNLKELIEWLLGEGKDHVVYADSSGPMLGFTKQGVSARGRGVPDKEVAATDGIGRVCDLVVDKRGKVTPKCLVLFSAVKNLKEGTTRSQKFRFSLTGKLEKVISGTGKIYVDENGKMRGVRGSAVDTVLDVKDPEVKRRAIQELAFWRKRAAKLIAQKAAAAAVRQ